MVESKTNDRQWWILTSFTVNEGGSLPMPLGCHNDIICSLKPVRCATTARDVSILKDGIWRYNRKCNLCGDLQRFIPLGDHCQDEGLKLLVLLSIWSFSSHIWPVVFGVFGFINSMTFFARARRKLIRGGAPRKKRVGECLKCIQSGCTSNMHIESGL